MGKAGRWMRGVLGLKKEKEQSDAEISDSTASKEKKRWSFTKAGKECPLINESEEEQSKHRLSESKQALAALRIQTVFRGYLARKARRALKGVVKVQALVRGFLVRKRASTALFSMEALVRAQLIIKLQRSRPSSTKENRFQPRKSMEKKLDGSRTSYNMLWDDEPKNVCVERHFKDCSNLPNYMSNTQSYMAKMRSNSAPKQRTEPVFNL